MRLMKDSGIEWIKEIPESWNVARGKTILKLMKRSPEGFDEVITCFRDGEVTLRSNRREDGFTFSDKEIGYQGILKGDLVIHGMDGFAGAIGIADADGKGSPVLVVCTTNENSRFLMYYLRMLATQDVFLALATGIRERSCDLRWNKIADLLFPVPAYEEQTRIADYLDVKCTKIDTLIAKQQEIIEKLKAYKLSVITEAVAPKPEWTKGHLGYVAMFKNGLNYSGVSTDAKIKFLGVGDFQRHFRMDNPEMFSTLEFDGVMPDDLLLKNGDIVFVRSNGSKELVGRSVLIDNVDFPLTYSGFCIRMRNIRQDIVLNEFLMYCFWSHDFRQGLNRDSRGSNINNLNQELLSKLTIAFPSVSEQKKIICHLDKKCIDIERTIASEQAIIGKLTEYKKSLIYEVVTGKREV